MSKSLEKIKKSSILWGNVATPERTISEQSEIVMSEVEEFVKEKDPVNKALECADIAWTLGYLEYLCRKAGNDREATLANNELLSYSAWFDALAFEACIQSNWSKFMHGLEQAEAEALKLMRNDRFSDVRVRYTMYEGKGLYYLTGTDHQGGGVQENKLLKPSTYVSKEVLYARLKGGQYA
jgi:hypothetical protein